nr:integrase, catalytic region, zinc finger, CCHC-type, peptidase aspartic, catalytic [Tanacetum cinerariifolium]
MGNLPEDIQCAGSDTRPPMLDRTDFASWQQHIRLYCRGKENGVNILNSIDEGPFQMGTVWEPLVDRTAGAPHLGPERPRVYADLSPEEKDRYNADIRATNILLQGLPKDIYTLINHYTDAKDIWDNVKMLLEGSELIKEDRKSQLYDDFEHFQCSGLTELRSEDQSIGWRCSWNFDYYKDKMLLMQAQENGVALDEEELLFLAGGQDNTIDEDVDEKPAPTAQTMFMANLSSADHVYDEAGPSYDSDILSEVHDHDHYQDAVCEHHEEHAMHDNVQLNNVVDSHADYTSDSNMISYDRPDSPNVHRPLQATATKTTTKTTTTHPPPPQPLQSTINSMLMKHIGELEQIMANLIQDNKHLEERDLPKVDMKEILHQRMWETNSYKAHEDHMMLYEALEKSMNRDHTDELLKDLDEARKKKKKRRDTPKTPPGSPPYKPPPPLPPIGPSGSSGASGSSQVPPPPPSPLSTNQEGQSHGFTAPSSSKIAASAKYKASITTDTRLRLYVSSTLEDLHMDDDMAPDAQVHSSDDEDIGNAHVPKNNWASALASTYSPPPEDLLLVQTGDMEMFMDWFCKRQGITELKPQDLEGPAFELVKVFHLNMWIEEECKYDIAAMYDISHWWFQRQRFYIDKHTSKGDRRAVRTHMQILSVVRIKVFSMYGYGYMKNIVLRRADLYEHIIAERDFKYLYLSDFEDLKDHVKPTVLTPGKYAIDVEPISSRLRNNREAHLDYLRHLKESIETIREIVEEAKV